MYTHSFIQKAGAGLLALSLLLGNAMIQPETVQAVAVAVADPEIIHLVQRGDTLYRIAQRYGTTVQALMSYNSLASTAIYVGQRLLIPIANSPQEPSGPITYVVQPGDTLSGIARRYNTSVAAIKQSNGLSRDAIYVGQRLQVPVGTNVPNPPPPPPPAPPANTVERIQFRPGATSDTRGGYASAIEPNRYVLGAAAGQQMTVQIKTASAHIYLNVLTPNGTNLAASDGALHYWQGTLPASGDYTLEVRNSGTGLADYGITVTITGSDNAEDGAVQTPVQSVMAQRNINMRNAPRTSAAIIGYVAEGMIAKVTGKSVDQQWWRVVCPGFDQGGGVGSCWVSANPALTQPTTIQ